ncbi:MAG TPA: YhjD/YihY/BrkB family envelope integrity protein [Gaiellaceae bacterium]
MHEPQPRRPLEVDVEPSAAGRMARWLQRARAAHGRVDDARGRHSTLDVGLAVVERDSAIGGALLAGALAYRLFVLLLPTALLLVSGLGLYADVSDKTPGQVAQEAGINGLIASEVASTASGRARGLVFILMIPAVLYATTTLYRALAKVHALVWEGSARGVRLAPRGVVTLLAAIAVQFAAVETVGWIRRNDRLAGVAALVVYLVFVGGAWLAVSLQLPHRDAHWTALLPGSAVFGVGLLFVNVFNVYVTTRLVEGRADTYGALGIAAALLFSLVLVGRVMIVSAELNALLHERRG